MKPIHYRPAKIEIDLSAIKSNIKNLQTTLAEGTEVIAVVKANGYGHGDVQIAKAALEAGATQLAVALLEEAIKLRQAGITAPILVMGWVDSMFADVAIAHDITLTVFQSSWLDQYYAHANLDRQKKLAIHIKLDSGMGRIGLRTETELKDFLARIDSHHISVQGVFTHFSTADEPSTDYYYEQLNRFESMLKIVRSVIKTKLFVHIGNSATALRQASDLFDGVRFGIGMYGLYPSAYINENRPFKLQPALSLKTQLSHVKKIEAGEKLSYGTTYEANQAEWIGTIPIGYGDGIQRKWQGLEVLIDGKRMPIVGRVCMDQCMVRLDRAYPIGTEVTFIGQDEDEAIQLEEIAAHLETINYEVACLLTTRLPRIYFDET